MPGKQQVTAGIIRFRCLWAKLSKQ